MKGARAVGEARASALFMEVTEAFDKMKLRKLEKVREGT
jgi:hypothetical protein